MVSFVITMVFSFVVYLLLTAGSGTFCFLWTKPEMIAGLFFAFVTAAVARHFFCQTSTRAMDLRRWGRAVAYLCGPFFSEMTKANLDVAYRVLTGRIHPGIVRVKSGMSNDLSVFMLASSITLTPGTLTVGVDEETNDLYVHMINLSPEIEANPVIDAKQVFGLYDCPAWIRRIAE